MENSDCEKKILDFLKFKLENRIPEINTMPLQQATLIASEDKLIGPIIIDEYEGESVFVSRQTAPGNDPNTPNVFYFDKNTDWFQFTKPIIEPGFRQIVRKRHKKLEYTTVPSTLRHYKNFKKGDLLTVWQTIGKNGPEHLVCAIVSNKTIYSFGFGYAGAGEKMTKVSAKAPRFAPFISDLVHTIDYHPGAIYTPDYLFEQRIYDQIIKKRTQVRLIANSYLTDEHIHLFHEEFDQIDYLKSKDAYSFLRVKLVHGDFMKVNANENKLLEISDYFTELIERSFAPQPFMNDEQLKNNSLKVQEIAKAILAIDSSVYLDKEKRENIKEHIKSIKKIYSVGLAKENLKELYIKIDRELDDIVQKLSEFGQMKKPPHALCYIRHVIPLPQTKYCEWTRSPITGKSQSTNCASFMKRLFSDILSCSKESLYIDPKLCYHSPNSIKSNCSMD